MHFNKHWTPPESLKLRGASFCYKHWTPPGSSDRPSRSLHLLRINCASPSSPSRLVISSASEKPYGNAHREPQRSTEDHRVKPSKLPALPANLSSLKKRDNRFVMAKGISPGRREDGKKYSCVFLYWLLTVSSRSEPRPPRPLRLMAVLYCILPVSASSRLRAERA